MPGEGTIFSAAKIKRLMEISVVIPTYRRPALLRRCLDALSLQTVHPDSFEVLVVSDGYDVVTARMIKIFRNIHPGLNLHLYSTAGHVGPAAARNFGWRRAQANLVAFTDDDCIPDRHWLESFVKAYRDSTTSNVVFTGRTHVPISDDPTDYEKNIAYLEKAEFITANCCCVKSALLLVDGFDERFKMAWREDSDLQFKMMKQRIPILPVPSASVTHPVRNHQWTDYFRDERKGIFNALLYKKYPQLYRAKIERHGPINYYLITAAWVAILAGAVFQSPFLFWTALTFWMVATSTFILRRLKTTSHSRAHVGEMIITSIIIPPVSLYWRWYGAIKYQVWIP
jgi:GT2 family glycosyltransferase